jgi:uncharacterized protein
MSHPWARRGLTLLLALAGTGTMLLLGLPLPFLFGPLLGCGAAALLGAPLKGFGAVSVAARPILGVAVGASVTPAVVAQVPSMVGSLVLVPVFVAVIGLVGVPFFRRIAGFDPATAFYAAMPGGASDMVLFGEAAGGNVRSLSLVHATRVAVIVTLAPIVLANLYGVALDRPLGLSIREIPLWELGAMAVLAGLGWWAGKRVGLFGAPILGPLLVTIPFAVTGLIDHRPPKEAVNLAQFLIGTGIAVYYVGITWRELTRTVALTALFCVILAVIAAAFAETVTLLDLAPAMEAFLAFAPGGQAEMTVLAIVAGADLGFVVVHHLMRIMVVILGAPLVARRRR